MFPRRFLIATLVSVPLIGLVHEGASFTVAPTRVCRHNTGSDFVRNGSLRTDSCICQTVQQKETFSFRLFMAEEEESTSRGRRLLRRVRNLYGSTKSRVRNLFRRNPKEDEASPMDSMGTGEDVPSDSEKEAIEISEPIAGEEITEGEIVETMEPRKEPIVTTDQRSGTSQGVDLSGSWNIIVSDDFKDEYEKYLTLLGQPMLVRSVALSIVSLTTEETKQSEKGRVLAIKGHNVRGTWDRTLNTDDKTRIVTADGEHVEAEAWWEGGKVHRSWLRGVSKYGGGSFESKRYLESGGKVLVCESTFHPDDEGREKAQVTWRFLREGEKLGDF